MGGSSGFMLSLSFFSGLAILGQAETSFLDCELGFMAGSNDLHRDRRGGTGECGGSQWVSSPISGLMAGRLTAGPRCGPLGGSGGGSSITAHKSTSRGWSRPKATMHLSRSVLALAMSRDRASFWSIVSPVSIRSHRAARRRWRSQSAKVSRMLAVAMFSVPPAASTASAAYRFTSRHCRWSCSAPGGQPTPRSP